MNNLKNKTLKYRDNMISRRKFLISSSAAALAGIVSQYNPKQILAASGENLTISQNDINF